MQVLIACDKFRGSLTANAANAAVGRALAATLPDAQSRAVAIADGGEGTVDALATDATRRLSTVSGPYGDPVEVVWLYQPVGRRAVIEMAAVAGHAAAGGRYDPDRATSRGVGELIKLALAEGAREVIVAVGGSVTVDGGAGALEALGARYRFGDDATSPAAGRRLGAIEAVELSALDPALAGARIVVAADVDNPLTGPDGAAAVFGPQKGVAAGDIEEFDAALARFDRVLAEARGGARLADAPFAGAAGGMLVGLAGAAEASARDGFALVAEHHDLEAAVGAADLVVTGEGSFDRQSLSGKGPIAVARLAAAADVPVLVFAGRLALPRSALVEAGITAAFAIARGPATLDEALAGAADALEETAANAFALYRHGGRG